MKKTLMMLQLMNVLFMVDHVDINILVTLQVLLLHDLMCLIHLNPLIYLCLMFFLQNL